MNQIELKNSESLEPQIIQCFSKCFQPAIRKDNRPFKKLSDRLEPQSFRRDGSLGFREIGVPQIIGKEKNLRDVRVVSICQMDESSFFICSIDKEGYYRVKRDTAWSSSSSQSSHSSSLKYSCAAFYSLPSVSQSVSPWTALGRGRDSFTEIYVASSREMY